MSRRAAAPQRALPSLAGRISTWLALHGLLAALTVSALVFVISYRDMQGRQAEELRLKSDVVRHALAETSHPADLHELRHKFEDFLAGHEDIVLTVTGPGGAVLFDSSASGPSVRGRLKDVSWSEAWPAGAATPVSVRLLLDVSRDDALLWRLGWTLLAASLAAAAVLSVTGYLLVSRGLRPVHALSDQVDAVALDRSGLRLDGSAQPRELVPLVEHFNTLLARIERAYAQLEGFNADVAHELRTPLTTLIGSSELALHGERSVDELREVIAANLDDLRRLGGIVNDMLFVSHADRGAVVRRREVDSLAGALGEIVDFHEAALHERGLRAVCVGDARGAFDVSLLRRAVSNLLGNAARYAAPGSVIRVRIDARPGRVRIAVENDGDAIGEPHLERLFDRFYRAERSRRSDGANYGLGLAIVAAIARMHGGETFATSAGGVTSIGIDVPAGEPEAAGPARV